ncbi:MAG: PorV/PorQ family protein [Elusimicrobiota bacterium]
MRRVTIAVALCVMAHAGRPASASSGRAGGLLLQQPFGPRAFALGSAYSALGDDAFAMAYNPASLARLRESQVALQMIQGLETVKLGYGAFATPLSPSQAFGAAVGYLDAGRFDIYDDSSRLIGSSSLQRDMALELGYASGFPVPLGRLNAGASIKLLRSRVADEMNATAYAGSIGLNVERPALGGAASLALVAANVGPPIRYSGGAASEGSDPLPLTAKVGLGLSRAAFDGDRVALAVEYARVFYDDESFTACGLEYAYKDTVMLRVGQRFGESLGGPRLGIGVRVKGAAIDYALGLMQSVNHVHQLSVNYRFFLSAIRYRRESEGLHAYLRRVNDMILEERYFDAAAEVSRLRALDPRGQEILALNEKITRAVSAILEGKLGSQSPHRRDAYALAFEAYEQKQWTHAVDRLVEASVVEPANEEIVKYLQKARAKAEQERAQTDLRQKARIGTLFEFANTAYDEGDMERSLKIIEEILRLGPYQPAESLRQRIARSLKDNAKSLAAPSSRPPASRAQAAAPAPSAEDIHRAEELYYEGLRQYAENNPESAMKSLREGLRLDPRNDSLRQSLESIEKSLDVPRRDGGRP